MNNTTASPSGAPVSDAWKNSALTAFKQMLSGVALVATAAIAIGIMALFERASGRLIVIAVGGGGLGLLLILIGIVRLFIAGAASRNRKVIAVTLAVMFALATASTVGCRLVFGTSPPAEDFVALLGKHPDDPEVRRMIGRLGVWYEVDQHDDLIWNLKRVRMRTDREGRIESVALGDCILGQHFYGGQLPAGLVAGERQEETLKKLGMPDSGDDPKGDWVRYLEKGFAVEFEYGELTAVTLFNPKTPDANHISQQ